MEIIDNAMESVLLSHVSKLHKIQMCREECDILTLVQKEMGDDFYNLVDQKPEISFNPGFVEGILIFISEKSLDDVLVLIGKLENHGLKSDKAEDFPDINRRTFYLGNHIRILWFFGGE